MLRTPLLRTILLLLFCSSLAWAQAPTLTLQLSHSMRGLALSPDGKLLVSVGENTVKVWDIAQQRLLRTLEGHTDRVVAVAISPDGKHIASASWDGTVKIWELVSGASIRTLKGHSDALFAVKYSPDGRQLASAGKDMAVVLWDAATGAQQRKLTGHSGGVYALAYTPDSRTLASGGQDFSIKLWNVASGTEIRTLKKHLDLITSLAFSPDGRRLASGSKDLTVGVWDVATGGSMPAMEGHEKTIYSVAFSPDGQYVASGGGEPSGAGCEVKIWDANKAFEPIIEIKGHESQVSGVVFSPDSKTLYSSSFDATLRGWDYLNKKELFKLEGLSGSVYNVKFSPDGSLFAAFVDGKIIVRNTSSGRPIAQLDGCTPVYAFAPNSKQLAAGLDDGSLGIFNAVTGKGLKKLAGHRAETTALLYTTDGSGLISAGADATVRRWNLGTGSEEKKYASNTAAIYNLALSADGRHLAGAARDKNVYVWEVENGAVKYTLSGHAGPARSVAFSFDGSQLASGSDDKTIRLWSMSTGQSTATLSGHNDPVTTLAYRPGGKQLASACGAFAAFNDRSIKLWDLATGKVAKTLDGHKARVYAVSFSAEGSYLASASEDTELKFWGADAGKELFSIITYVGGVDYTLYAKDGRFYGTETAAKKLYYVQGNNFLPLESFYEKYFDPNLWANLIYGVDTKQIVVQAQQEQQKQQQAPPQQQPPPETKQPAPTPKPLPPTPITQQFTLPPVVTIRNPRNGMVYQTEEGKVRVGMLVVDQGGGIDEVRLYQNGKLISDQGSRGMKNVMTRGNEMEIFIPAQLVPGNNEFKAIALNKARIESQPSAIYLEYIAPKPVVNLYLIAVGINAYKNPKMNLNYGKPDALAIAKDFQKYGTEVYTNIVVKELYDAQATRANVEAAFKDIATKAKPEDTFVFYYAGHGVIGYPDAADQQSDFFLVMHDVEQMMGDFFGLTKKGVAAREMSAWANVIQAQKQLFMLDACQSGGAVETFTAAQSGAREKAAAQLARTAGMVLMSSAGSEQFAVEFQELGHGVFTYAVLKGMSGKADGGRMDGRISVNELKAFVEEEVREYSKAKRGGQEQSPYSYSRGQDFIVSEKLD